MLITQIQDIETFRSALWDITGTCNLRCKHCYQFDLYDYSKRGRYQHDISTSEAKAIVDRLSEAGFTHIHFLGGEPLLRPDLLEIIEDAKSHNMYISVNTNGLPLNAQKIRELEHVGVNQLMVSLDGATPFTNDAIRGKGTFSKILKNIQTTLMLTPGSDMMIGITFTSTASNSHEIPQLFKLVLDNDIEYVHIVPVHETGNFIRNSDTLGNDELLLISCLEKGLLAYGKELLSKVRIRISLRLWPIEILNRKYGNILEPDPIGVRCLGGKKFVVIQADGRLGPCTAGLDSTFNAPIVQREKSISEPEYVHTFEANGFDESTTLKDFYLFQEEPDTFGRLQPCDRCRFRDSCQPCPLEYHENRIVHQCIWAEQEEKENGSRLLDSVVVSSANWSLQGEELVNKEDNHSIDLGPMMTAILQQSNRCRLGDILDGLFTPPLTDEQRREILDTIEYLMTYDVLEVRHIVFQERDSPSLCS